MPLAHQRLIPGPVKQTITPLCDKHTSKARWRTLRQTTQAGKLQFSHVSVCMGDLLDYLGMLRTNISTCRLGLPMNCVKEGLNILEIVVL